MTDEREACGRCSMSTAVDVANAGRNEDERAARDPYAGDRIEVDEDELRLVSPAAWLSGVSSRLNSAVDAFVWKR
ncbi:hypothetical protein [Halostagnicola sp. A-GB9-2]|uniref:hypothetical protein n=1 Tax=Halostagnicola sp. A-GB9-2 TaxID=3048066 RepID=UPI0024C0BC81|nr:hypothetical protein [Halostagnicola sp. A-GB9-2]MDJ1433882.1 hypothetical protein [Halostagnicola sp. A-GB9-2]